MTSVHAHNNSSSGNAFAAAHAFSGAGERGTSRHAQALKQEFDAVDMRKLMDNNQQRLDLEDAARFLSYLLDLRPLGALYRTSFALRGLLLPYTAAERDTRIKLDDFLQYAHARAPKSIYFDINVGACCEAYLDNLFYVVSSDSEHAGKKFVDAAVESIMNIPHTNNANGNDTNVAQKESSARAKVGKKKGAGGGAGAAQAFVNNPQQKQSVRSHAYEMVQSRMWRTRALNHATIETRDSEDMCAFFGLRGEQAQQPLRIALLSVICLPERLAHEYGDLGARQSLARQKPAAINEIMFKVLENWNQDSFDTRAYRHRLLPTKYYSLMWPRRAMRMLVRKLMDDAGHSLDALKKLTGERLCQIALGDYMFYTFAVLRPRFAEMLLRIVRSEPTVLVTDFAVRDVLKFVAQHILVSLKLYKSASGDPMPNNLNSVNAFLWDLSRRYTGKYLLAEAARARSSSDDEQAPSAHMQEKADTETIMNSSSSEEVEEEENAPEAPHQEAAAANATSTAPIVDQSVPVLDMISAKTALFNVPATHKPLHVPRDATAEEMERDFVLGDGSANDKQKFFTDALRTRALFAVHSKSGVFERVVDTQNMQCRTPQELLASGNAVSEEVARRTVINKRSGGGDDLESASDSDAEAKAALGTPSKKQRADDDNDNEDDDGDNNDEAQKALPKELRLNSHGRHLQRLVAAQAFKRNPTQNMTQMADEMGFVEFEQRDSILERARVCDLEMVHDGVHVHDDSGDGSQKLSNLDTLRFWYALGSFNAAPMAHYYRSVLAASPTQIVAANVDQNDVTRLAGPKIVHALREICENTVRLYSAKRKLSPAVPSNGSDDNVDEKEVYATAANIASGFALSPPPPPPPPPPKKKARTASAAPAEAQEDK